jgi:hypothetical protein
LGDLNEGIVFVGEAVVGLYIADPAEDDVFPIKDIFIANTRVFGQRIHPIKINLEIVV